MEDKKYKIYVLTEPDGETVRYVGYTGEELEIRLKWHLKDGKNHTFHRANWINSLLKRNQIPIIKLIDFGFTLVEVKQAEIYYIKLYKELGAELTNGTIGGDGNSNPSKETKNKISETLKRGYANGTVKKQRPMLGKQLSEEWKNNISASGIGKNRSNEACINISNSKKGEKNPMFGKAGHKIKHTAESKLKISLAGKGRKNLLLGTGKIILQFDLDGNFLHRYISASLLPCPHANVYRCCKGKTKTAYSFIWKFENKIL